MSVFERIRRDIPVGTPLKTPVRNKPFTIERYEPNAVVFSVGVNHLPIPVPRACWDGIPDFLRGKPWVRIGSKHDVAEKGTLEEYLDTHQNPHQHRHPSWGSYVVPVLEHLGIVEVDHCTPSKVRLK